MDTLTTDIVTPGLTTANAIRPGSKIYEWARTSVAGSYELSGSSATVGYLNNGIDVDLYHITNGLGAHGTISTQDRYLYIASTGYVGGGPAQTYTDRGLQVVGIDFEVAQGGGQDDPFYNFLSNYN